MLCVQVDLVLGTIQCKADSALSLTAIDVIDEQGLYLLGHVCSVSLVELCTRLDDGEPISTPRVACWECVSSAGRWPPSSRVGPGNRRYARAYYQADTGQ